MYAHKHRINNNQVMGKLTPTLVRKTPNTQVIKNTLINCFAGKSCKKDGDTTLNGLANGLYTIQLVGNGEKVSKTIAVVK